MSVKYTQGVMEPPKQLKSKNFFLFHLLLAPLVPLVLQVLQAVQESWAVWKQCSLCETFKQSQWSGRALNE